MRSVQEHIEQADRYADAVIAGLVGADREGVLDPASLKLADLMTRAGELELKLAEAKSKTTVTVADG